ncbi:MAG: hypothetical protein ACREDI_04390 [Roseiarcus sp.]
MIYICDAPGGKTWFRLETELEAAQESAVMQHAVEKYFLREKDTAGRSFQPGSASFVEQEIGLKAHLLRDMPLFLTLRDGEGAALATAMLPPGGRENKNFRPIIGGPGNGDPYPDEGAAIDALARHFGLTLERERCYPYRGG